MSIPLLVDDGGMPVGVYVCDAVVVRYQTPTGQPCPRSLRVDGTVWGSGDCQGCGYCLLLEAAGWPVSAPRYGAIGIELGAIMHLPSLVP